jgi:ribosomal protein L13E
VPLADFMLVAPALPAGPAPVSERGYRSVATGTPGVALHVAEGHSLSIARAPDPAAGVLAVVIGQTTSAEPARVLAEHVAGQSAPHEPGRLFGAELLVGNFACALVTPHGAYAITDHLGVVPVYRATAANGSLVVGTHLHHVAETCGLRALDVLSACQFMSVGRITDPFTMFEGVARLPAGSVTRVNPATPPSSGHYWLPRADRAASGLTLRETAVRAREIMANNIAALVRTRERVIVQMSAGEDSRVLAALAVRASERPVRAVIFLDGENREWKAASAAARALGLPLEMRRREPDHYTRDLEALIELLGADIHTGHAHARGLVDPAEADLFIDGWGSDALFKAWYTPRAPKPTRWRDLRLDRHPGGSDVATQLPFIPYSAEIEAGIAERVRAHERRVSQFRPERSAPTWARLWPIAGSASAAHPACTRRFVPNASPYLFGNLVDAIAHVAEADKLNRRLFALAFAPTLGRSGFLPASDGVVPRAPARVNLLLTERYRRARRRAIRRGARVGDATGWLPRDVRLTAVQDAYLHLTPHTRDRVSKLGRGFAVPEVRVVHAPVHDIETILHVATVLQASDPAYETGAYLPRLAE